MIKGEIAKTGSDSFIWPILFYGLHVDRHDVNIFPTSSFII